jgi:hypothetical protein
MLSTSTTLPGPAASSTLHHPGRRPLGRIAGPTTTESRSMIRQTSFTATEADAEERSMRFVEYVLAFVAILAAGILAFIR